MNEKIVVNGYYFNAEGQILLSCATDSVNSICVKEPHWDKEKWSPLPRGPTSAHCPPHPCSAKPPSSAAGSCGRRITGLGPQSFLQGLLVAIGRLSLTLAILVMGQQRGRLVAWFALAILMAVSKEVAVRILRAPGTLITFHPTFFRLTSTLGGLCRLQCVR